MNFKKDDKVLRLVKHIGKNYDVQSQVKMQKILYFLSLDFYQKYDQLLFDDPFQAWIYGPVQFKAFGTLKKYGFDFTNDFWVDIEEIKPDELQEFIATEIKKYLKVSLYDLSELSHQTTPWIKKREGLDRDEISRKWIDKDEFKKYAKSDDYNQLQKLSF